MVVLTGEVWLTSTSTGGGVRMIRRVGGLVACGLVASIGLLAGCGGSGGGAAAPAEPAATPSAGTTSGSGADLGAVKDYVMEHTALLTGFTAEFAAAAREYFELANGAGFDYQT